MQIIAELQWSQPETVNLKNGNRRDVRTAPMIQSFWDVWNDKAKQEALRKMGITPSMDKRDNAWKVKAWTDVGQTLPGMGAEPGAMRPVSDGERQTLAADPAVNTILDSFPGADISGVKDTVSPKEALDRDIRAAVDRALQSGTVSRDEVILVMREIAIGLKQ